MIRDRHYRSIIPQAGAPRLSVEALLAQEQPTGITLRAQGDTP